MIPYSVVAQAFLREGFETHQGDPYVLRSRRDGTLLFLDVVDSKVDLEFLIDDIGQVNKRLSERVERSVQMILREESASFQ